MKTCCGAQPAMHSPVISKEMETTMTTTIPPTADTIALEDGEAVNMGEGFMLMLKDDRGVAQSVYGAWADLERLLAA